MKKTFTAFALALVLSIVVAPGSSAAIKAGASCKKAGLINITGGFKHTCVNKSGKLVWGKGVAVKASAKPTVTPTAKPTVSASAAPTVSATPSVTATQKASSTPTAAATVAAGYTMTQVKANKSASKCWSVINEKVYDLTAWINAHPGGSGAIVSLCGTDGTQGFLAMHRNQSKPESRLAGYLLGPLTK